MTEMNNTFEARSIHVVPFLTSLILAPVASFSPFFLAAGIAALFGAHDAAAALVALPAMTIVIGGFFYLLIGIPMLIWHLRRKAPDVADIAILALFSQLWLVPMFALVALITFNIGAFGTMLGVMFMGLILGPLWGACFGAIYKRMIRAQEGV